MSAHAVPLVVRGSATAAASTASDLMVLCIPSLSLVFPSCSMTDFFARQMVMPFAILRYDKELSGQNALSTLTTHSEHAQCGIVRRTSPLLPKSSGCLAAATFPAARGL